jgi:class 3 adenylate cyclase
MRSALVVPIMHEDRVFAILTLAHGATHHYDDQKLRMIRALAGQIVHIVAHSQLIEHIEQEQRHNSEHQQSYHALLSHLPSLIFEELKRDDLLEALAQPHHSRAIALSIGLRNMTQLSKALEPEMLIHDVIQPFMQAVTKTAHDHYCYLDHCDAHGAMLLFNYPRHTSDAAVQAAAAAQQLNEAFAQLRQRWRTAIRCDVVLTIGIAQGDIITGQTTNDIYQGQYVVIGPAVSEAQHLHMLARSGEVLCNAAFVATFNHEQPESEGFVFEALQPLPNGQENDQPPYRFTRSTQGAV